MPEKEILELLGNIPGNDLSLPALAAQMKTSIGVIPFIGAGMSAPFGFQQWTVFLRDAAKLTGNTRAVDKQIAAGQYEEAAETLITALTPSAFQDLIEGRFGDRVLEGKAFTGAITLIPRLNSGPVITTNFDRLLEHVFQNAGCPFEDKFWHSKVDLAIPALERNNPVLLKLHGDWKDPEHRVLTLSEYRQNYGDWDAAINFNLPLPQLFKLLAIRPVLFLGCSLSEDRTVKILKRVAADLPSSRHYALVQKPKSAAKFHARMQLLAAYNIRPVWYPEGEYAMVESVLEFLAGQIPEPYRRKMAGQADKPKVTIPKEAIPKRLTTFIGRESELKELSNLAPAPGLLTITGGPGAGKSRIAIELVRLVQPMFDSAWFVELSQMQEANLVPQRVATAVGTREQAGKPPTEALRDFLRLGKYLVVLDNCEHVRQACTELAGYLLRNCSQLTICATSREVLRVPGEQLYPLPPLELPPADRLPEIDKLKQIESVKLFLERAGAAAPFQLTAQNASDLAELCRELEGIPLAIELAAAQSAVLSVQQILRHMNERLRLLTGGLGGTEERQWTTLREAIRFSYEMLNSEQSLLLRRLSVFHRNCSWEAVTAICHSDGQDQFSILKLLAEIQARSLLMVEEGLEEKRYRLLNSIREFAAGELGDGTEEIAEKHAAWFLAQAEEAAPELLKKDQALWLNRLSEDADNLRAAIRWAVSGNKAEIALRLLAALWRLMEIRAYFREGRERLEAALAMPGVEAYPALRSKALSGVGMLAYRQGDMPAAKRYFAESLAIERERQDKRGMANALNDLGNIAQMAADFDTAGQYFGESLALERETKNARGEAVALYNLGSCARRVGKLDEAEDLMKQSWRSFEAAENLREAAFPLNGLAWVALARGKYDEAIVYAEKSLKIRSDLSDKKGVADCKRTLGAIALRQPNLPRALDLLTESLDLTRGVEDRRGIAETLEQFAAAAAVQRESSLCAALYAAAQHIRDETLVQLSPLEQQQRQVDLDAARVALGAAEFDKQQAAGRELTLEGAVETAASVPGRVVGQAIG